MSLLWIGSCPLRCHPERSRGTCCRLHVCATYSRSPSAAQGRLSTPLRSGQDDTQEKTALPTATSFRTTRSSTGPVLAPQECQRCGVFSRCSHREEQSVVLAVPDGRLFRSPAGRDARATPSRTSRCQPDDRGQLPPYRRLRRSASPASGRDGSGPPASTTSGKCLDLSQIARNGYQTVANVSACTGRASLAPACRVAE